MTDFAGLLARVREAKGPDRQIDADVFEYVDPDFPSLPATFGTGAYTIVTAPLYTASIDAALALVERMLPGWFWRTGKMTAPHWDKSQGCYQPYWAHIQRTHADHCDRDDEATGYAQTAPLAILSALLRALSSPTLNSEDK